MKFCQSHWTQMKDSIKDAGLYHLVGKSGADAIKTLKADLTGTATNETFDPLLALHNEILARFMEPLKDGGMYLFTGDYCPLCELDRLNPGRNLADNWVKYGTADLKRYCEEKGLAGDVFDGIDIIQTNDIGETNGK